MKRFIALFVFLFALQALAASSVNNAGYTLTTSSVSTSAQILAKNANRRYLLIQNLGTAAIYVKVGSTIATSEGITIPAGGNWEPTIPPTGTIWMKASTGTQTVTTYEGN